MIVCDPAGPGFDSNATFVQQLDPMSAAENVQCIHTSIDKGTSRRQCHQNWMLGVCGWYQIASGPPPFGSHGLCPFFYNSAFHNKFKAIPRPTSCSFTDRAVPQSILERGYYMGYNETRSRYAWCCCCLNLMIMCDLFLFNSEVIGDLYANTYRWLPYNIDTTAIVI